MTFYTFAIILHEGITLWVKSEKWEVNHNKSSLTWVVNDTANRPQNESKFSEGPDDLTLAELTRSFRFSSNWFQIQTHIWEIGAAKTIFTGTDGWKKKVLHHLTHVFTSYATSGWGAPRRWCWCECLTPPRWGGSGGSVQLWGDVFHLYLWDGRSAAEQHKYSLSHHLSLMTSLCIKWSVSRWQYNRLWARAVTEGCDVDPSVCSLSQNRKCLFPKSGQEGRSSSF